ncbi:hypothetical protein LP419_06610 [Massilia sp. H-1]|nr:hypothetical protein LP419_06610 [Massilia sp. H-1]
MDDTLEYIVLLGFVALIMLYFMHVKLDNLTSRLKDIEEVLGVETELEARPAHRTGCGSAIKAGKNKSGNQTPSFAP